jgi:cell division protein FtsB
VIQEIRKRKGLLLALGMLAMFGWAALSGPEGLRGLLDKRRMIRELQEQNAEIQKANKERRERILQLEESPSEQELEIRKQMKLAKPGDTTIMLPEHKAK